MEKDIKKKYTMRDSYIGTINDEFYLSILLLISIVLGSGNLWVTMILGACAIIGLWDAAFKFDRLKRGD